MCVPWSALGHQRVLSARQPQYCQRRRRHRVRGAWDLHQICKFCWKFEFTLEPLSQDLGWNYSYSLTFLASVFLKINQFSKKKNVFIFVQIILIDHALLHMLFIKLTKCFWINRKSRGIDRWRRRKTKWAKILIPDFPKWSFDNAFLIMNWIEISFHFSRRRRRCSTLRWRNFPTRDSPPGFSAWSTTWLCLRYVNCFDFIVLLNF